MTLPPARTRQFKIAAILIVAILLAPVTIAILIASMQENRR